MASSRITSSRVDRLELTVKDQQNQINGAKAANRAVLLINEGLKALLVESMDANKQLVKERDEALEQLHKLRDEKDVEIAKLRSLLQKAEVEVIAKMSPMDFDDDMTF